MIIFYNYFFSKKLLLNLFSFNFFVYLCNSKQHKNNLLNHIKK